MAVHSIQTLTLEYRVFDRFDGETEAPPFSEGVVDERGIYVFEVARLGIVPLRFGEEEELPDQPAAPSPRYLTWTVLRGLSTASPNMGIGGQIRQGGLGAVLLEPTATIADGAEGIYLRRCVKVPQGGVILLDGVDAPADGPAIFRCRVQIPQNSEQRGFLDNACCCKSSLTDINLPDGPSEQCPPTLSVLSVSPLQSAVQLTPIEVQITGSGFSELAEPAVAFLESGGPGSLEVTEFAVQNDNLIVAQVIPSTEGVYDVFVGDASIENCVAVLTIAFRVAQA